MWFCRSSRSKVTASQSICGQLVSSPTSFSAGESSSCHFLARGTPHSSFSIYSYTPFDADDQVTEIQKICSADYAFEPAEYWTNVSPVARDFINKCLSVDQKTRLTATEALNHPWFLSYHAQTPAELKEQPDLLPTIRKQFDAKKTFKRAILTIRAAAALKDGGERRQRMNRAVTEDEQKILDNVERAKANAEKEAVSFVERSGLCVDDARRGLFC